MMQCHRDKVTKLVQMEKKENVRMSKGKIEMINVSRKNDNSLCTKRVDRGALRSERLGVPSERQTNMEKEAERAIVLEIDCV